MVPVSYYVALSAILFAIGALGVLIRRNAIIIFMSIELMLNAGNLLFVAFARSFGELSRGVGRSGGGPGFDRGRVQEQAKHRY